MAYSFLNSFSQNYKPQADPYMGSGFYVRDPAQELLEMRADTQKRVRDIAEKSQLAQARQQNNFLRTVAGPQNIYGQPRNEREAFLQSLVDRDIRGRIAGVEMAPKWDDFRAKQINRDINTAQNFEQLRNIPISRALTASKARREAGMDRFAANLRAAENARDERALQLREDDALLGDYESEYLTAEKMIASGVDPAVVGRLFPELDMVDRSRLAALARSPGLRAQIAQDTGMAGGTDAQRLAEEYNRREQASKKHAANLEAMRKTPRVGFWDYLTPGYEYGPDREAIANYPGKVEDMLNVYKADPVAKKLIRPGASGWEPIVSPSAAVNQALQNQGLQRGANAVGSGQNAGRIQIRNAADYLRLPPGTPYIDPSGQPRTKPR